MERIVRIGGACAFIGDSVLGPRQLVEVPGMNYLVFDYLAEMTLSSFVQARKLQPESGYASDFVQVALAEVLPRCLARGIRLVANAGGLNPRGCAEAIATLAESLGCQPRIAFVEGDDCMGLLDALRAEDVRDFYSAAPMPPRIDSANAYLGAAPIAQALALGADIVITGRIVDSATTLGILMHEFGWQADALDLLAAGSLAGHILECGAQATGGIFTDWADVADWDNIGYPYIDCHADGTLDVRKPAGTGGLLNAATVSEQILYEVGDPGCYVLPDVVCDLRAVQVQALDDAVRVTGVRGLPPPPAYKVSATYLDGYRCTVQVSVFGLDAIAKARRTGEALLTRVRRLLAERGLGDFSKTHVSVLGAEDSYGPHAQQPPMREAVARVAVTHPLAEALDILSREARAAGVSFAPGTTSGSALTLNGRAAVEPRYRLFSFLLDKQRLPEARVTMGGQTHTVPLPAGHCMAPHSEVPPSGPTAPAPTGQSRQVPLITLAYGRSGDKGDSSNIAVIARRAQDLPLLRRELTPERVRAHLGHLVHGPVVRYEVPGLHALNFLMQEALDGGGPSSLRPDPMGKGMAQQLLGMEIGVDQP